MVRLDLRNHCKCIIALLLLFFCSVQKASPQGLMLLDKEIAFIDSCQFEKNDNFVSYQRVAVFSALLKKLFDLDFFLQFECVSKTRFIPEVYNQVKARLIEHEDYYAAKIDSVISKEFVKHKQTRFGTLSYELVYLHFLDQSLDNHVLDFSKIVESQISKISNTKDDKEHYRVNGEFVWILSNITDSIQFDPHSFLMSKEQFETMQIWFDSHKEEDRYDSIYLNALTEYMINRQFWQFE